jgi:DNA-binding transcriptional MerR regulator
MKRYSGNILKKFGIQRSHIWYWRKVGLLPPYQEKSPRGYSFNELLAIKIIACLTSQGVKPARIKNTLDSLNMDLLGYQNPLLDKKLYVRGKEIFVFQDGKAIEPRTGQYLLFDLETECKELIDIAEYYVCSKSSHPDICRRSA